MCTYEAISHHFQDCKSNEQPGGCNYVINKNTIETGNAMIIRANFIRRQ